MKKNLLVLAGVMTMATAAQAMSGSFLHEFRYEDRNRTGSNGNEQIEWTLAKGKVNLTDSIRFDFDIDKDIFLKDGSKTTEGWDTAFGMNFKGGSFNMFGYEWTNENYFGFEFDDVDFEGSAAVAPTETYQDGKLVDSTPGSAAKPAEDSQTTKERYYISPRINAQITDWTWFQIDPRFVYENTTDDYYMDLRFQAATDWGNGWDNWFEMYNFIGQDDRASGDKSSYSLDVENYLAYTKQLGDSNFYSWTEFGVEAYGMADDNGDASVSVYADPQIQYRATIGGVSVRPYVGYTMYEGDDNFQQLESGVKFQSKF